ncbi:porin [uncultured Bradyrhizobium sp.]|uniref:porin n=1 Tax=uncultured Bradyrhizobium sp. TaxID=199684 RepID=UPI0035CA3DDE
MKMVKSLILGSAAGLIAMSGAQAADLPVKAKAVEYVRICSLYGAGFWYIPGTDTCMKIGGYLRIDTTFNGGIYDQPAWAGDLGQNNRYVDHINSRSRMALTVDTRTATEYGVVRTFAQGDFQFNNFGSTSPTTLGTPLNVGATTGISGSLLNNPGGGYVAVEFVFIQFAGFTFGKSASAYATPWHGYPGNNSSFLLGGHDTVTGVNNIQYTAQFGNGVSGTIGLDDPTVFNRTTLANLGAGLALTPAGASFGGGTASLAGVSGFGAGTQGYAGWYAPDVVGNIRVDQAWGLFQISGALHEVRAAYFAPSGTAGAELTGHPETKWGGSVMAALQIKNIPTGPGDDIKIDASWSKGDTKNVISTSAASPSFLIYGAASGVGASAGYDSIGFGATTDGTYLSVAAGGDGTIHLTEAYGVRGAFNHNWDPYWSTSLFGSYASVRYDNTQTANICSRIAITPLAGATCDPDFNVSQLGVVTRWTPVKNLTFSAEVQWFHLDQKFSGLATFAANGPKPAAVYQFKDQDAYSLNVRAQRNF